ncbi:hypothetical protein GOB57_21395 [Sinorhizobium meliloti]|nr:hypothetical protein [Sinorhizobium meliloti]
MTTVALSPYNGATRKGVEQIQTTLRDAVAKSRAALEAAIKDNEETATDVFHPSERAFQTDWEKQTERRKRSRTNSVLHVKLGTALYSVITLGLSTASYTAFNDKGSAVTVGGGLFFALLALAAGVVGAVPYVRTVRKHLRARSLGYIEHFTHWNTLRMHMAWAVSEKAVYAVIRDHGSETLTVNRIPFDAVQACAFREFEGTAFADIYSKAGNFFTIIDPTSDKVSGAKNLVDLINATALKK